MEVKRTWFIRPNEPFNSRIWNEIASELMFRQMSGLKARVEFDGTNKILLIAGNQSNTKSS